MSLSWCPSPTKAEPQKLPPHHPQTASTSSLKAKRVPTSHKEREKTSKLSSPAVSTPIPTSAPPTNPPPSSLTPTTPIPSSSSWRGPRTSLSSSSSAALSVDLYPSSTYLRFANDIDDALRWRPRIRLGGSPCSLWRKLWGLCGWLIWFIRILPHHFHPINNSFLLEGERKGSSWSEFWKGA